MKPLRKSPTAPAWLCALCVLCTAFLVWPAQATAADGAVLIGHASLPRVEAAQVARLYTGRSVEVAGQAVTVVNAPAGGLRSRFLQQFLQQDDEHYRAYWTVRRHVGKGAPPRELASAEEVIEFVRNTPGAVGYIDAADLRPGLNVIAR